MKKMKVKKGLKIVYKVECLQECTTVDPEKHWTIGKHVVSKDDHDKLILNKNFKSIKQ